MKRLFKTIVVTSFFLGPAISLFIPLTSSSEDAKTEATPPTADMAQLDTSKKEAAPNSEEPAAKSEGEETKKEETATATEAAPAKRVSEATVSSCLSDPIVLDEIKKKHEEIDKKWKDLEARETEIKARETAINEELKKLQAVRDEIAKTETSHLQANQEKVAKVVETLETMNPKASSAMLATLDQDLAVMAMDQMSTPKLAKVMNLMEPARATKLTELLAGVVRAKHSAPLAQNGQAGVMTASNDAAEASIVSEKSGTQKGEIKNDQQSEQIISSGPDTVAKRSPSSKKSKGNE